MQYRIFILFGCAVLSATPALADPREETLAGISRCAHLPDNRTFLDCLYGAAQPMRAALGLPPAPLSQTELVPPAGDRTQAQNDLPPTAGAVPATKTAAKSGGWLGSVFGSNKSAGLRMASYTFDKRGLFTVTLNDGEVWRQTANDTNYATWRGQPADYVVSVIDSAAGAKMDVRGEPGPYSVQRVR